jgi:hypothetical protein
MIDRGRDYRKQHAAVKVTISRRIVSLKGISCHRSESGDGMRLFFAFYVMRFLATKAT